MIEDFKQGADPLRGDRPAVEEQLDGAEIWGRRIGRGLGLCFALFLLWALLSTYVFK